jgi:hypothetical protein
MYQRRFWSKGFLSLEHRGQHLILDPDQAQSILGDSLALRRHQRHLIAHEAQHRLEGQQIRIEAYLGHVPIGQYRVHARDALRLRGIEMDNPCVRVRTAQYPSVQHARPFEVSRVACLPTNFLCQPQARYGYSHHG